MKFMFLLFCLGLCSIILSLFFYASKKSSWNKLSSSIFECGFTSYYFSRFSFSVHYYLVGLIFLMLDLELCFFFPFMVLEFSCFNQIFYSLMFVVLLGVGLGYEWFKGQLEWKD